MLLVLCALCNICGICEWPIALYCLGNEMTSKLFQANNRNDWSIVISFSKNCFVNTVANTVEMPVAGGISYVNVEAHQ